MSLLCKQRNCIFPWWLFTNMSEKGSGGKDVDKLCCPGTLPLYDRHHTASFSVLFRYPSYSRTFRHRCNAYSPDPANILTSPKKKTSVWVPLTSGMLLVIPDSVASLSVLLQEVRRGKKIKPAAQNTGTVSKKRSFPARKPFYRSVGFGNEGEAILLLAPSGIIRYANLNVITSSDVITR